MVSGIGSSLICFSSSKGRSLGGVLGVCGRRDLISSCYSAESLTVSGISIGGCFGLFLVCEC